MREPPPAVREPPRSSARASWTAGFGRLALVSVAVALFLTFTGAFGLDFAPTWKRLAYWLTLLLCGSALSIAGQAWLLRRGGPHLPRIAALALGLTAAMTPVVFLATRLVFGGGWSWLELAGFVGPVFIVSAAMTALNVLTLRAREARAVVAAPPGSAPTPATAAGGARFRERLPLRLRGAEIYAVEAEDHYLRVHTDRGSDLLLLRLADAIEELAGIDGARTHRSWWVAREAVADARRGDGRATLVLKDGTQAPVSRSYAPALREAGWF